MLNKLVNWSKKLLPIIGAAVFGVGLVMMIVLFVMPHSHSYTYKETVMGQTVTVKYVFDDSDELVVETTSVNSFDSIEVDCKISDGKLYTYDRSAKIWAYEGKINAFKISYSTKDDPAMSGLDTELSFEAKSTGAIVILVFSIVFMVCGAITIAGAYIINMLDKKGKFKVTPAAETTTETVPEIQPEVVAEPVEAKEEAVEETKTEESAE